jgi:hypothetical protein
MSAVVGLWVTISACGAVNVPSEPKHSDEPTNEREGGGDSGPVSVKGRSFSMETFYASFVPPNRQIVQTIAFGSGDTAVYSRSVIDGDRVAKTQKTISYKQNGSVLTVDGFEDDSPAPVTFQLSVDGLSMIDAKSKAVYTQVVKGSI